MKKYLPLITFTIFHDYYNNGKFCESDLLICEGRKTAEKNYGLVLRKKGPGVFILYIDGTNNFRERLRFLISDLKDPGTLSFLLVSGNNDLQTFTKDIGIKSDNKLLKLKYPVQSEEIFPDYRPGRLEKTSGNTTFEKDILKRYPNALIDITLNTKETDINSLQYRIENNNPLSVVIRFEAKSLNWKYILLPRNNLQPDLSVIDSMQRINFSGVKWTGIMDRQPTGIACSEGVIAFSETYPFHFQLWKNYFNGRNLVIDRLSFPDPANTGNLSHENGNDYVSIFQYF